MKGKKVKMRKAVVVSFDNGIIRGGVDEAFFEFIFGKSFVKKMKWTFLLPTVFAELGWVSHTSLTKSKYEETLSGVPEAWLEKEAQRFAKERFPSLLKKNRMKILSLCERESDELLVLTTGLEILVSACMKSIGIKCKVVGNELLVRKGRCSSDLKRDVCVFSDRFLMMCDALDKSPDELWVFGAGRFDDSLFSIADVYVDLSPSDFPLVLRGEAVIDAMIDEVFRKNASDASSS